MIKNILSSILLVICSAQAFASESGRAFQCTWLPSVEHKDSFFLENAGFTMSFQGDGKVLFKDNSFFVRDYEPCWNNEHSSCSFSFDYNEKAVWNYDSELNAYYQDWVKGSATGSVNVSFSSSENGTIVLSGESSEGVSFKEVFSCLVL